MAAGIFGALGALGGLGNQVAEGQQLAHEEIIRRLAEAQARQTATLNQQRIRQQIEQTAQNMKIARQPQALGNPYVSSGKVHQRYQDPLSGDVTDRDLPGGLPETPEQAMFRGLMGLPGMTEQTASETVVKKLTGKTTYKREVQPDASSPTGFSAMYYDGDGGFLWSAPTLPPRTAVPRETTSIHKDQYGNETSSTTISRPMFGGNVPLTGTAGRFGAPQTALGAVRSAVGLPPASGSQAQAPNAMAGVNSRPANPQKPAEQGTLSAGPYRGLDQNGQIPADRGVNPQVRQFAQNIMDGGDVNKIPVKARALAESVARRYGWKGQGALTPAQQMQIQQVDSQLATISQDKYMKLFDSASTRLHMAMLPLDPATEGGFSAMKDSALRGTLSKDQADFLDDLTRLRGVITGIRSFTGANNSNATAGRLLAELPNFSNTTSSADAKYKISRIQQELAIIKRLGYFLPDEKAPAARGAQAAPAANAESEANRLLRENGVIQ